MAGSPLRWRRPASILTNWLWELRSNGLGESAADELFGEGPSTVIISAPEENISGASRDLSRRSNAVVLDASPRRRRSVSLDVIDEDICELLRLYENALPGRLGSIMSWQVTISQSYVG